jgi:hypothetical protein
MSAPAAVAAPLRAALRTRGGAHMPLPCIAAAAPLSLAPRRAALAASGARSVGVRRAACRAGALASGAVAAPSLSGIALQQLRGGAALLRAAWPALRRLGAAPAPRAPERGARGVTRAAADDGGGQKKVRSPRVHGSAAWGSACSRCERRAHRCAAALLRDAHAPPGARALTQRYTARRRTRAAAAADSPWD